MTIDKKLEHIKLLHMLSETFGDSEGQSPDEIREELRGEGFDINIAEAELINFQREISMAAKRQILNIAKINREGLIARQKEIMAKFRNWTREQLEERLKEILSMEPDAAVAYRDLKTKGDEDIKEILVDIELARLTAEEGKNGTG